MNLKTDYRMSFPKERWECTGCRQFLKRCRCGRAAKNRCTGCGQKLWLREGRRVLWGESSRELCAECAAKVPRSVLMDGGK